MAGNITRNLTQVISSKLESWKMRAFQGDHGQETDVKEEKESTYNTGRNTARKITPAMAYNIQCRLKSRHRLFQNPGLKTFS